MNAATSPPKTRLAFRVGVVGHRPNRLPEDRTRLDGLRSAIHDVLQNVGNALGDFRARSPEAALYTGELPILRAISPLAEGTDRIFAEEALGLGYELCCPMPFAREEFEKDFAPPLGFDFYSAECFRGILDRAREKTRLTTFELDGGRDDAPGAYGAGGRVVLNQSDLLVVIWDGQKAAGAGGTVDTLHEALLYNVPVIWIDAFAPDSWQLLHGEGDLDCLKGKERCAPRMLARPLAETIREIVFAEVGLPDEPHTGESPAHAREHPSALSRAREFFAETRPVRNHAIFWKFFRDAVGSCKWTIQQRTTSDFESQIAPDWPVPSDPNSAVDELPLSSVAGWANAQLRTHYAWADKLADLYADSYRSAYLWIYFASAIAVLVALIPMWLGHEFDLLEYVCTALEFLLLGSILWLLNKSIRGHSHDRWMEYRLLAELIRQLRFLVPLGGYRPVPRVPPQLAVYGDPKLSWMYWHMRAIARAIGIPQAKVDPSYARDCLGYVEYIVGNEERGQLAFHNATAQRDSNIHRRLHAASFGLFIATLLGILAHVTLQLIHRGGCPAPEDCGPWLAAGSRWLVVMSAFLPALGAALAGINNQGEFARIAKRSAAMASGFRNFHGKIAALKSIHGLKLANVAPLAGKIAEAMVEEVVDWRVVFIDRPPTA